MRLGVVIAIVVSTAAMAGCSSGNPQFVEKPVTVQTRATASADKPPGIPDPPKLPLAPATLSDVKAAVNRIFGETAVIEVTNRSPYVIGDFNADQSEDVAVVLKPAPNKVVAINDPLSNWIIQDPHHVFIPPRNKEVVVMPPPPKREVIQANDTLLAVIHGVGPTGFRNPIAIQTFVLRNVVGGRLVVSTPSESLERDFGRLPAEQGVIAETLNGESGVLYWTGAGYAWHKESVPVRMASAQRKEQPR
jgi:hypothetical protein